METRTNGSPDCLLKATFSTELLDCTEKTHLAGSCSSYDTRKMVANISSF